MSPLKDVLVNMRKVRIVQEPILKQAITMILVTNKLLELHPNGQEGLRKNAQHIRFNYLIALEQEHIPNNQGTVVKSKMKRWTNPSRNK